MFWYWHHGADTASLPWWLLLGPAIIAVVGVVVGNLISAWFQGRRAKQDQQAAREAFWTEKRLDLASELLEVSRTVYGAAVVKRPMTPLEMDRSNSSIERLQFLGAKSFMMFEGIAPKSVDDAVTACSNLLIAKLTSDLDPSKKKEHEEAIETAKEAIAIMQHDLRRAFTTKKLILSDTPTKKGMIARALRR